MLESPKTSIIIVSFNTREILRGCLARLFEVTQDLHIEVIVVDNNSRDASAEMVERDFPAVKSIRSGVNLGFAAANNLGFKAAGGEFILLLNPDALLEPGALHKALAHISADPAIGMGGGRLLAHATVRASISLSAQRSPGALRPCRAVSKVAVLRPL